ncbi:MAG: hypothetical protein ACRD1T_23275, partial [Acidimicrobiia bacterium]
ARWMNVTGFYAAPMVPGFGGAGIAESGVWTMRNHHSIWLTLAGLAGAPTALLCPVRSQQGLRAASVDGAPRKFVKVRGEGLVTPILLLVECSPTESAELRSAIHTRVFVARFAVGLGTIAGALHHQSHRQSA